MNNKNYYFKDDKGTYFLNDFEKFSGLYMPLANTNGLLGSITPSLNGDLKIDQHHFALLPVTKEDLHSSLYGRNIWFTVDDSIHWCTSGNSVFQLENPDLTDLEIGLLYQKVKRKQNLFEVTIKTFIPIVDDNVEITKIKFKNTSNKTLNLKPTVAIPLFSRSADSIRDHRHVTSLLNRAYVYEDGIINHPTMSFDERGHKLNETTYGVFAKLSNGNRPSKYYPTLESFIGVGGNLIKPKAIYNHDLKSMNVGDTISGHEVLAGIGYDEIILNSNEEIELFVGIFIDNSKENIINKSNKYLQINYVNDLFINTKKYWEIEVSKFQIETKNRDFSMWLKWVTLQPIFRRIYGNSFLPHHDYGRGGKGWRDLWQDCLSLIIYNPNEVEPLLYNNYAGVRIDGSNATIIGSKPGEFIADRNNIVRVWMDHGAWPFFTTNFYLERSGDYDFLFKKQSYFKDSHIFYSKKIDQLYNYSQGTMLLNSKDEVYYGTILEHILIQNIIPFFNVGSHNIIRLEGGDWNDGLDMARDGGESVAFSAFYTYNLMQIIEVLKYLKTKNIYKIDVLKEFSILLDSINKNVDYKNINYKTTLINTFFESVRHNVNGQIISMDVDDIIEDLTLKVSFMSSQINTNEWLDNDQLGFYNGYYDNNGEKLERINGDIRMTLTGQVFPIMAGIADSNKIKKILDSANEYLYDQSVGGYRLNNNFNELKLDMGRLFGFAFGHKENGAMFSHMSVMFAYSLLKNGFVTEGTKILDEIFEHTLDIETSSMLPGIPEYIDDQGRGMYPYLTGSASWYIMSIVDQVYGIKGHYGDILFRPKLIQKYFDDEFKTSIILYLNNCKCNITYYNPDLLSYDKYKVGSVKINNNLIKYIDTDNGVIINKNSIYEESNIEIILVHK